jgi:hypothetical protein
MRAGPRTSEEKAHIKEDMKRTTHKEWKCLSFKKAGLEFGLALVLSWFVLALWEGNGDISAWSSERKIHLALLASVGSATLGSSTLSRERE